ncbi:zinc finger protein ZAT12-like [Sesamum indicum]|uniref:Zinc finger protein ZAT12-like n=1 Tax=Sesamum indicum TaxID=4182 RepID=A0A6I9U457_SESIN|nr:zinc finger protein ZAT12-like [Sesamum indicum]
MTMMKRTRDDQVRDDNITALANCLMLLSSRSGRGAGGGGEFSTRVFTCKTCNRQFPSFQALGGHRASHKKPRLMAGDESLQRPLSPPKPKTHECSICGLEFPIGQALGGHMRRHRAGAVADDQNLRAAPAVSEAPIVKRANSRRVLCMDLNLTPLENKFVFGDGIINPAVDCFF